ncbi:MAG: hydroxymethylbilane synthase [Hyphomicrobiales bacterium]|nr:hydroxymethylbilane synthase [Hyphomicrobiales bacterium]
MSETGAKLRLGTRGSPLALAQAHELRRRLAEAGPVAAEQVEIVVIRTSGDRITDRSLAEAGGKGLFTKELDEALLDRRIDIAVHSAKDLPTLIPPGIAIAGYLPREDARDALIAPRFGGLDKLPAGALIGTASVRREAQLKRWRPDIEIRLMRGNVDTRLRKLAEGECDATLLALAGLKRLGRENEATEILDIARFIPAVGQGAIAITTRTEDERLVSRLAPVLDKPTERALAAERAFLNKLDGSCRTPIAGHAVLAGGRLRFCGLALKQNGTNGVEVSREGAAEEAEQLGADAAGELLARLVPGILAARG